MASGETDYTGATMGVLVQNLLGGFGDKPKIPAYNPVDTAESQKKAIAGNLSNQGAAQKLASSQTAFNLDQLQGMLSKLLPGYTGMRDSIGSSLQSQLRGEIPASVQDAIQNSAAARAFSGGFAGSGAHSNLVARDFGMTSYDITNRAMDSASRWIAQTENMGSKYVMDASSMFLNPSQQVEVDFRNTENQWNRDLLANQIHAMPSPFRAALGKAAGAEVQGMIKDVKQMFESMYGGKMGGASGGGGGGMGFGG